MDLCVCVFQYLHENGVVHRDLKPENLLYADLSLDAPLKIGNKPTGLHPDAILDLMMTGSFIERPPAIRRTAQSCPLKFQ